MKVYREQTEPLIAYYRGHGIVADVDGHGSIEEVGARIERALGD